MSSITREQAATILRKRLLAKHSFKDFCEYVDIPGVPLDDNEDRFTVIDTPMADHHLLTVDVLQRLVDRQLTYKSYTEVVVGEEDREIITECAPDDPDASLCMRVMLMLPPGSAKSTYASVCFPPWVMQRFPMTEVILTGYGDTITKKHGKKSRQLVSSPSFKAVAGCGLEPTMKAADDWSLTNHSTYKSSGITSGITGFRCDGLVWDDLIKGRRDADSFATREMTYNAYIDDARSRKKPTAWEVGIGTRWHEDDVIGRILPKGYNGESGFIRCRDGNVWNVICLAAQCERDDDPLGREVGEMIWPEWFGEDYWADKKVNPRSWASLYQQRPAPEEGIYFKKEHFRRYSEIPQNVDYYISFDPAVTEREDADSTAIQVWAVDQHARCYLVDEWVRKVTMDVWIAQLMSYIQIYRPMEVISEAGVIRRAAEPFIKRAQRNTGVFAIWVWINRHADKSAMARSAQAMYASGQMYHPNNSIGENTESELLRFPSSADDHRVDAVANLCLRLEKIWEASPPRVVDNKRPVFETPEILIKDLMPPRHTRKKSRWAHRK